MKQIVKKAIFLGIILVVAVLIATPSKKTPQVSVATPAPKVLGIEGKSATTTELFRLTNKDRETAGLSDLIMDSRLESAASSRASYFCYHPLAHFNNDGVMPWDFFGAVSYPYADAGENLAKDWANPQDMETAFMASATHRGNILKPEYTDVGIGWQCGVTVVLFGDK